MSRPSIVFITTDTQGREMLSCYVSRPGVATPHLDRLASQGVRFTNAFTTSPLCTPARSSWYTGLFPSRNGAWGNEMAPSRHVPLLADLLRGQGYRAMHIGKWHLDGAGYDGAGVEDGGFEAAAWYDLANFYDEVGRDSPNQFGGWNKGLHDETYCFAHRVADRAIRALEAAAKGPAPLFLSVSFDEPHGPYICPPPFRGRFSQDTIYRPPTFGADLTGKPRLQQAYSAYLASLRPMPMSFPAYYHKYYDCNSYVDHEIGRVLDAIDRYCPDDTVVIFTSDHGDHLGAFGLCAKGPTMYDHTTAVPLLIRAGRRPGNGGRRVNDLVSAVDVWATIMDLAGRPEPVAVPHPRSRAAYTGRSLVPVLRGEDALIRDHVIIEYNRFGLYQSKVDGLYPIRCIRTQRWKLSINLFDRDELYDLEADPDEAHNLIDEPALRAIRADLHDRLLAWQEQTADPFRAPAWAERPWRSDYARRFEGLTTTGYSVHWDVESFR